MRPAPPRALLPILALLTPACASPDPAEDPAAPAPVDVAESAPELPALRAELLELARRDQQARGAFVELMKTAEKQADGGFEVGPEGLEAIAAVRSIDAESSAFLEATLDEHGWPTLDLVGEDGAHAAWLLVQHADEQPELQRRALAAMQPLVGTGQVAASDFALLTDRVRTARREPQLYGTQFAADSNGVQRPLPIEDPGEVDARRAEVGLPTLADYAAQLGEFYGAPASAEPMASFP